MGSVESRDIVDPGPPRSFTFQELKHFVVDTNEKKSRHPYDWTLLNRRATTGPNGYGKSVQHPTCVPSTWGQSKLCMSTEYRLLVSIPIRELETIADGLNIEGVDPSIDAGPDTLWVNSVLVLDRPLLDEKRTFAQIDDEKRRKGYPLLENVIPQIDEQAILDAYMNIILFYTRRYDRIAVHIHQSPEDAAGWIELLRSRVMYVCSNPNCEIDWRTDNPSYRQFDAKAAKPVEVLISLSQCAGLNSKFPPGVLLLPSTVIPFHVNQNVVDARNGFSRWSSRNSLRFDLQAILHEWIEGSIPYTSPNPLKSIQIRSSVSSIDDERVVSAHDCIFVPRACILQVTDLWNPTDVEQRVDVLSDE